MTTMGSRRKFKLLKLASVFFLLYVFVYLDLTFYLSKYLFSTRVDVTSYPSQNSYLRKWEETNIFYKNLAKVESEESDLTEEDCLNPRLVYRIKSENKSSNPGCQRMKPVSDACKIANSLFADKKITDCSEQKHYKLCEIKGDVGSYFARCDISICEMPIVIGNINQVNGEYVWKELSTLQEVENHLSELLKPSVLKKHYGFCFVKCILKNSKKTDVSDYGNDFGLSFHNPGIDAVQLLVLPADVKLKPLVNHSPQNINYNLIFIDSVSRNHFYRSLPRTIKVLNDINKNNVRNISDDVLKHMVLDFELLQGIKSRTFESLQALFSGYVNPKEKPFGVLAMPPKPLNTQVLLGRLKQKNYKTLWIEDLCWKWEWGLSKELLVHNKSISDAETWKHLKRALHKAAIDDLDITFASCQILDSLNVKDPFHYADDVCFLGRHHHEYIIEYLQYYQHILQFHKNPYISFYETNVGHEDTMLRIQHFDESFANYLKFTLSLKNTLTVIFSDHGNTYGSFVQKSDEARIEIFHPLLFMVIPPDIQKYLGPKAMNSLINNQERLITLQDLHKMLFSLSKVKTGSDTADILTLSPHYRGLNLMEDISKNRSCSQISRLMPNTCICQGYDNAVKNDSYYGIVALYATGMLNQQIQKQFRRLHSNATFGFGFCRRLILSEFTNVKISYGEPNNTVNIKMDLLYRHEMNVNPEIFVVAIRMTRGRKGQFELMSYERITPYSIYSACCDAGVDVKLCICNSKAKSRFSDLIDQSGEGIQETLSLHSRKEYIDPELKCFYFVITESDNNHGFIMEAVNVCQNSTYRLSVGFWKKNMITTNLQSKIETVLQSGDVTLVFAAVQRNRNHPSDWKYTAKIKLVS
ncbi:hypothetical protein KUTeg_024770 [Tegillarca granosa]|uniref:Uncharacterized protein n=1 Tax=Tegillarca granosa TaxID=220873 RepID=A0ABQ9DYU2_TEGGR|nr:hypothetical protein KUTeg_024770 [Tegillarca granosa]